MIIIGNQLEREQLRTLTAPTERNFGSSHREVGTWAPVQHGELADTVVDRLGMAGLEVTGETWGLARGGMGLLGAVALKVPEDSGLKVKGLPGGTLEFGVRHSNDGQWALACLMGGTIDVCTNGMLMAEFVMSRKHTAGLDLTTTVDRAIETYLARINGLAEMQATLANTDLSAAEGTDKLVAMAEAKVYPWSLVKPAVAQWRNPNHPEFKDRNAWSLYMGVSEVIKVRSPRHQLVSLAATRAFLLPEPVAA